MNMTNMILANRSSPQAAMRTGVHLWNHQQYCCLKTHMTNPLLKTLFLDNSPDHISVSDVPLGNQTLATEHRHSQSMETSDCQVKRLKDTPLYPSLLRLKSKFACRAEIQLCVDQSHYHTVLWIQILPDKATAGCWGNMIHVNPGSINPSW